MLGGDPGGGERCCGLLVPGSGGPEHGRPHALGVQEQLFGGVWPAAGTKKMAATELGDSWSLGWSLGGPGSGLWCMGALRVGWRGTLLPGPGGLGSLWVPGWPYLFPHRCTARPASSEQGLYRCLFPLPLFLEQDVGASKVSYGDSTAPTSTRQPHRSSSDAGVRGLHGLRGCQAWCCGSSSETGVRGLQGLLAAP